MAIQSSRACLRAREWQPCVYGMSRLASAAALLKVTTQYSPEAMFQPLDLRRCRFCRHVRCCRPRRRFILILNATDFAVFRLCLALVAACLAGEACRESSRRQRPRAQRAPAGEPAIPFGGADGCLPRVRRRVGEADDVRVGAHPGGERQR